MKDLSKLLFSATFAGGRTIRGYIPRPVSPIIKEHIKETTLKDNEQLQLRVQQAVQHKKNQQPITGNSLAPLRLISGEHTA